MKQPVKGSGKVKKKKVVVKKHNPFKTRNHKQEYGTSKLETYFATEFLDKLGLFYVYEYEAKDIKRFFDFAVTSDTKREYVFEMNNGIKSIKQNAKTVFIDFIIEVDGDYHHGNPDVVDVNNLNPMQKHNRFVDGLKDEWCAMHCIPLLRIWENDIRHNPKKVMDMLKKYAGDGKKRRMIQDNKKRPH